MDDLYGFPRDTDPAMLRECYAQLRRMTPQERLLRGFRLTERTLALTAAGVGMRHPEHHDESVRLAVIRLTIGEKAFQELFPGVEVEPQSGVNPRYPESDRHAFLSIPHCP